MAFVSFCYVAYLLYIAFKTRLYFIYRQQTPFCESSLTSPTRSLTNRSLIHSEILVRDPLLRKRSYWLGENVGGRLAHCTDLPLRPFLELSYIIEAS